MTSSVIRKSGKGVAALDIEYFKPDAVNPQRSNHFDILSHSGFSFHGFTMHISCMQIHIIFIVPKKVQIWQIPKQPRFAGVADLKDIFLVGTLVYNLNI